jgi:hypothetical protein
MGSHGRSVSIADEGGEMKKMDKSSFAAAGSVIVGLVLLASITCFAQGKPKNQKPKSETIQAQAMGQGTALGRTFSVTAIINEYSTPDDQQILIESFQKAGNEGLINALSKMKAKGNLAITGTLGFDVNYIREFPTATGRRVRLVTDRPVTFGEAWISSRSMDYTLCMVELDLSSAKGKSTGVLIPAGKLKINKDKELEIETVQYEPWKLFNIIDWGQKK